MRAIFTNQARLFYDRIPAEPMSLSIQISAKSGIEVATRNKKITCSPIDPDRSRQIRQLRSSAP